MVALNCPVCRAPFKEMVKHSVLIDVCTKCCGVWLDHGELDKLLDSVRGKNEGRLAHYTDEDIGYPASSKKIN